MPVGGGKLGGGGGSAAATFGVCGGGCRGVILQGQEQLFVRDVGWNFLNVERRLLLLLGGCICGRWHQTLLLHRKQVLHRRHRMGRALLVTTPERHGFQKGRRLFPRGIADPRRFLHGAVSFLQCGLSSDGGTVAHPKPGIVQVLVEKGANVVEAVLPTVGVVTIRI